ncbi:glutamine amidotransferase [Neobacillus sp. PS3-12]|uniref:type 1 glutamine amidotransferase n=1 Tax=Neobacillus sp. PS3-12 TaxID=3070677 RepID=UPI0027E186BE|nr:glutamine amidotransferase [Neobacillus sp. PS3-12]WML55645.1 glutamine amidotransferase [Neobacillus sp. PS3-12]
MCLKKRCEWRGITLQVEEINKPEDLRKKECDLFMIGGGSDREQAIATKRLTPLIKEIKAWVDDGVAGLTICGGYQFLGEYLQTNNGEKLMGMGILPFYSIAEENRLMTNLLVESRQFGKVVGFENHSGRTYHDYPTLGKVVKGYGNNENSGEEGLHYHHLIGTYLHGPILPKNPVIADYLLDSACERKYGKKLEPLGDQLENEARTTVWNRFIENPPTRMNRLLRKKSS